MSLELGKTTIVIPFETPASEKVGSRTKTLSSPGPTKIPFPGSPGLPSTNERNWKLERSQVSSHAGSKVHEASAQSIRPSKSLSIPSLQISGEGCGGGVGSKTPQTPPSAFANSVSTGSKNRFIISTTLSK